jgi:phospholipid/cholesterol/gamma-HCH transport system permease protein
MRAVRGNLINPFTYVRPVRTASRLSLVLGRIMVEFLTATGDVGRLLWATLVALRRMPQRREVIVTQLYHIGFLSLPVVLVAAASIGLVLGVQSFATLARLNAETMCGPMVNFSVVTQLCPVIVGLMLAGRVGSNLAAEIGTMKVTEQLDALRVMGTDPVAYLVAPRFLACVLLAPVLTAIGSVVGMAAGAFLVVGIWQVDGAAYWAQTAKYLKPWDVITGNLKPLVFGGLIALVACRRGLMTRGGATGVGEACTRGVVQACVLVLVANFLLSLLFQKLWHLLHPA